MPAVRVPTLAKRICGEMASTRAVNVSATTHHHHSESLSNSPSSLFCLFKLNRSSSASLSGSTSRTNYALLTIEIIEQIADFLFEIRPPNEHSGDESDSICCVKPQWLEVEGFMGASFDLHNIGLERWVRILTIRHSEDWEDAIRWPHLVRELRCLDRAFASSTHRAVLNRFPHLRAISVYSHEDISVDTANRFSYRRLFQSLPDSIRYLEIKHAHGPDINVISTIKKCCPKVEQLWLGRCTMFNRSPACQFWEFFPFDHDSYISIEGTEAYTHSLGQELAPLRHLKSVRLGVYLMPSSIVLAHRAYHMRGLPAPNVVDWQQAVALIPEGHTNDDAPPRPAQTSELISLLHRKCEQNFGPETCKFCWDQAYQSMQDAEKNANQILKEVVPSLEYVEWMNWFTPRHLGVSGHRYKSL